MKPDSCVESLETIHGAPMVGIQWHLEAFNPGEANAKAHQGIFKVLKTAGETYKNRQQNVTSELMCFWDIFSLRFH